MLHHPCGASLCVEADRGFLQLAESALARVGERWLEPWRKKVVVFNTSTEKEIKALLEVDFDVSRFAAFAYTPGSRAQLQPVPHPGEPTRTIGQVAWRAWSSSWPTSSPTLRHTVCQANRYGYGRFVRFFKALGDSHERPGSARRHANQIMRRTDSIGG